jgi:hypothetical protein
VADAKISALPSATSPLAGTEVLPIVQSGVTDKVTAADLLRQAGQTVTTSNPVLSLAQTWNAGGVTFTGLLFNATDTASASGSLLMNLQVGGADRFSVFKAGSLYLTAASAPAMRLVNGTSASASAYQFYSGTDLEGGVSHVASTGLLTISSGRSTVWGGKIIFEADTIERMRVTSTGVSLSVNTIFSPDNTYDIGASGATRPRSLFLGTNLTVGGQILGASGTYMIFGSNGRLGASGDGLFVLYDNATTGFGRLQFGGATSSFPALKRNAANLEVKLADDSAFADLTASALKSAAATHAYVATAIPAGGTAGAGLLVSSTANFGVFFGSGAPTLSAAKGSLYLRSDGSGATDRFYINTDGGTTWTAGTTVL